VFENDLDAAALKVEWYFIDLAIVFHLRVLVVKYRQVQRVDAAKSAAV
jgi:hypothetical protein